MSLKNAKVTKGGILLETLRKRVLIVPFKLALSQGDIKVDSFFNNQNFSKLFARHLHRYTMLFEKQRKMPPEIKFVAYFSDPSLTNLLKKPKHFLNNFAQLLTGTNIELSLFETISFFQNIRKRFPKTIKAISPGIFKILGSEESFYLCTMQMPFTNIEEKKNFSLYIQDFFAIITQGRISIDIKHSSSDKLNTPIAKAAVRITLEAPSLSIIQRNLKRALSLIEIFINQPINQLEDPFLLLDQKELQEHYGKIILNQGWNFESTTCEELLKFVDFFQLICPEKD